MKKTICYLSNNKIFLAAWVLIFCIFTFNAYSDAGEVMKVGYRILAPHSFIDNSKASGAAVEYMEKHIAPKMNVDIDWHFLPFSRLIKYIDEGEIDAVLLLGKNPERIKKYLYPQKPVTSMISGLALKKTHPLNHINTVGDLKNIKIGFTKDGYISPFMKSDQIQFEFTVGTERIWQQLLSKMNAGRLEAVYNPTLLTLKYDAKIIGMADQFKFIELPEPPVDLYIIFSKSAEKFYKNFDQVHNIVVENISYQDILKKYLE